ncbi:MAG: SDR family NAD(P)-dependent oxidoreductase [Acidimicrobiales bacterium]|nr:SDR family NAD(P)-dependent oxidoreductase [Acidimicrobiales bacterium]
MEINGSTILVTGASGGLGNAMCRELAERGANLVITARRRTLLEELAADTGAEVLVADLTDRADLRRIADRAASCDVLVANAGVGQDPPLAELTEESIDFSIDVNLRAPIVLAHRFATDHIAAGTPGHIVLIGSLAGMAASPGTRMYNATKFGLRGFALSFCQELEGTVVGCTHVAPGFIRDAGMFANNDVELPQGVRTKVPADVASGVVKAITNGPTEVFVSPPELRVASTIGTVAPALAALVQRKLGVSERTGS